MKSRKFDRASQRVIKKDLMFTKHNSYNTKWQLHNENWNTFLRYMIFSRLINNLIEWWYEWNVYFPSGQNRQTSERVHFLKYSVILSKIHSYRLLFQPTRLREEIIAEISLKKSTNHQSLCQIKFPLDIFIFYIQFYSL